MLTQATDFVLRKYFGVKRRVLAKALPVGWHYHVLNEYPKSGGSWIGEMFSEALGLEYRRDGNNGFSPSLIHGHFMSAAGLDGSIVVWRDGRDVLTSCYYFYTRDVVTIDGYRPNSDLVIRTAKAMHRSHVRRPEEDANFSEFLEMMLTRPVYPKLTWPQFALTWVERDRCHHVRYEDFKRDCAGSLQRLVRLAAKRPLSDARAEEIVRNHSFQQQAGRLEGSQDSTSFFRKGIVGDWKNHFSASDESYFWKMAGAAMNRLGYS